MVELKRRQHTQKVPNLTVVWHISIICFQRYLCCKGVRALIIISRSKSYLASILKCTIQIEDLYMYCSFYFIADWRFRLMRYVWASQIPLVLLLPLMVYYTRQEKRKGEVWQCVRQFSWTKEEFKRSTIMYGVLTGSRYTVHYI